MLLMTILPLAVSADTFLHAGQSVVSLQVRSEELQEALGAVLGCTDGGAPSREEIARAESIRAGLLPMWRTLPKNEHDRVEWRLLRFATHRHFMQRFHVLVRGLEPTIRVNSSHAGEAEILSQQGPTLAQALAGPQGKHGFSLDEAVVMIAALEHLLFDSDSVLLEKIYRNRRLMTTSLLDKEQLQALLTDYMVYWIVGDDEESAVALLKDPRLLVESVPHWTAIVTMVEGSVTALEFSRQQTPEVGAGRLAFEARYTFKDALNVAGSISRSFGSFWETQCQDTKASLMALDTTNTGRVRLADFYGANKDGEWRFGESEAYLRELGALDETSAWRGKQVIVSNYVQAASNCVVTRSHYLVCCMVECEEILGQVEAAVGAPVAAPDQLLQVVESIADGDDEPAHLDAAMRAQLQRVARMHGGHVPLHGRLFAQWLHYAFPRDCAFPHKAGNTAALTPAQFGEASIVSAEEVSRHVAEDIVQQDLASGNMSSEQGEWMTQWSEEEELLADYPRRSGISWDGRHVLALGAAAAVIGSLLRAGGGAVKAHDELPKSHFV